MNDAIRPYEKTFQVSTYECDLNRRWKPAAFFQHLTEAAGQHAARLGFGFESMYARNLFWVHARMKIQFYDFPGPEQPITIRTWPKTIQQKLFFIRDFEVLDSRGGRLAAATSAWLVMDAGARRLVPPQSLDLELPTLPERAGLAEPLEKLSVPAGGEERLLARAGYSAVDLLGHVNNSRYVEWICDCFPVEMYRTRRLDWIQVNYDREVRPGDEVRVLAQENGAQPGLWSLEGVNTSNDTRAFESMLQWKDVEA